MDFYIYTHSKPNGEPFYVGKGSKSRAYVLGVRNRHHKAIIKKYGRENVIIDIYSTTNQEAAFEAEKLLIQIYRNLGHKLANKTDGGEGTIGWKQPAHVKTAVSRAHQGKSLSAEHKALISKRMKGRFVSKETRSKLKKAMLGKKRPPHVVAALVNYHKGRKLSKERRTRNIEVLSSVRDKSKQWHRSEAGRKWHQEHAKKCIASREKQLVSCSVCNKEFHALWPSRAKYCDGYCKAAAYRKRKRSACL